MPMRGMFWIERVHCLSFAVPLHLMTRTWLEVNVLAVTIVMQNLVIFAPIFLRPLCASQTPVPYLICNIVSFLFDLWSWIIRYSCTFAPVRHTRPTFHVNWLTFQLRNLVVAYFLWALGCESSRGVVTFFCVWHDRWLSEIWLPDQRIWLPD